MTSNIKPARSGSTCEQPFMPIRKYLPWMLLFLPFMAFGLGSTIPNQDAEAIARGNAFIATADNPSAIYYNPAGITQLEGTQAQFGVHNLNINSEYKSLDGTRQADSKFAIASVPQLFLTFSRLNNPVSFGLGIYAPFGLGVRWGTNTPFSTVGIESKLLYLTVNPVVAWKILPNLSIAAGPTLNYAKVKLTQGIGLAPGDKFTFKGDGWDIGLTAGLLWKPHQKWAVGVNYRNQTSLTFRGHSEARPYSAPEHTEAGLHFPQSIGGGVSFRPTPQWNLETYVIWTDWDTLDATTFKKASGNVPFAFNWESSFMTGLGATRYLDKGWFVSAGYFFSQNSTTDRNFTPLVPDTDLHVGSVGCGHKGKRWSWVVSASLITGPDRTVVGSTPSGVSGETADGKYHWFNESLNFSLGYRF